MVSTTLCVWILILIVRIEVDVGVPCFVQVHCEAKSNQFVGMVLLTSR